MSTTKELLTDNKNGTTIHVWKDDKKPRRHPITVEQVAVMIAEAIALLPKGWYVGIDENFQKPNSDELTIWRKKQWGAEGVYSINSGKRIRK